MKEELNQSFLGYLPGQAKKEKLKTSMWIGQRGSNRGQPVMTEDKPVAPNVNKRVCRCFLPLAGAVTCIRHVFIVRSLIN